MSKKKQSPSPVAEVPKQTLEQIQASYVDLATKLGDATYRIEILKAESINFNQAMYKLNQDAAALQNAPQTNTVAPGSTNTAQGNPA